MYKAITWCSIYSFLCLPVRCFVLNIRQTQIQCVWESEMWKINEAEIPCYKANYFSLQWNILGFPRLTDLFRTEPRNFPNCAYFAHLHWMSFKRAETSSRIPNCKIMPPHSYLLCSYGWKDSTWNPLGNEHWFTPPPMSFPMGFRASIKLFYQESTVHEPLLCHFATKPEQILMHFQSAKNKN